MNQPLDRRRFLATSGQIAAGLGAASVLGYTATAAEQTSRQTLCISCRDAHLKQTGKPDCWSALESIGAEGVEANVAEDFSLPELYHPERKYSVANQAAKETLLADMKKANKRISALRMINRFNERPDFEIQWGTKVAQIAQELGIKAILIDVRPGKGAGSDFLDSSVATLGRLMKSAEATGVGFGIENHGTMTNTPEFLKPLFARVGSPQLGLTLDTANFYWYGHPLSKLYELYEQFAPRVFHTHCKSIRYPESEREKRRPMGWEYAKYNCPIYEGDIDFRRVVKILRAASYAGDLCLEDESLEKFQADQRQAILAKEIGHLKQCS